MACVQGCREHADEVTEITSVRRHMMDRWLNEQVYLDNIFSYTNVKN